MLLARLFPLWFRASSDDDAGGEGHTRHSRPSRADPPAREVPRSAEDLRDAEWVARIIENDARALESLMRAHTPRLIALGYSITRSHDLTYEIVQDVFMRLWDGRAGLDPARNVGAYLWHMTRNRAISALRHERSEQRMRDQLTVTAEFAHAATYNEGAGALDADTLLAEVDRVLDDLPERCREIFLLKWRFGMDPREIAERLGLSLATVRSQISRAVRRLARSFERK